MRFRYIKDPLFLCCFNLYWINFWLEEYDMSTQLLTSYLNDVICIPFWIPIMLWGQKRLGLRNHDAAPEHLEIAIPLVMWAVLFEVIIPACRGLGIPAVADPNDVLCYCAGAMIAVIFWRWYYGRVVTVRAPQS